MESFIIGLMNKGLGYFGVTFLIALENIFPPIPSEVILTFGGFMTSYTDMSIPGVIFFSTLGSLIGAIVLYYVGYLLNIKRIIKLVNSKLGKMLCLKEEEILNANDWFKNKGNKTVFFCRFIPVIRSLISVPAGIAKMDLKVFLILTTIGSLIWNTVLVVLGSVVGEKWHVISDFMSKYSKVTLITIIILLIIGIIIFIKKRRKNKID